MNVPKKAFDIIAIGNVRLIWIPNNQTNIKYNEADRKIIEEVWTSALEESGDKLFNAPLFSFVGLDINENEIAIYGKFVEYRDYVVQRNRPDLNFTIKPVAVSGITIIKENNIEYFIFAQRAEDVTEYPGFKELVPSGSIDRKFAEADGLINYKAQLLAELYEETGIAGNLVKGIEGFTVVFDVNEDVYDVGCEIRLDICMNSVKEKMSRSAEYQSPVFVPVGELENYIKLNYDSIVPTSIALIEAYNKYKSK